MARQIKPKKIIGRPPEEKQAPAKSDYSTLVNINKNMNIGLTNMPGYLLMMLLGGPYSKDVIARTHTVDVGPFKVDGLDPATKSLTAVMAIVKEKYPDLYPRLSHHGMRVPKNISGTKSPSLHSWGVAIDIKVDGVKDVRWNDKALKGLALIAPIFHDNGWYWGGAFSDVETKKGSGVYWNNEDSMHFEVSADKLMEWANTKELGTNALKVANSPSFLALLNKRKKTTSKTVQVRAQQTVTNHVNQSKILLKRGSKGHSVYILQLKLNHTGALPKLVPDSSFGKDTYDALRDFQRRKGLPPSGVLDKATEDALSSLRITIPTYIDRAIRGFQRIMK